MTYRYEKNPDKEWKAEEGSMSLYEAITYILRNDDILKGLVKYTKNDPNIRRGYQTTGEWKRLVSYYLQPEYTVGDFSPNIRQVPLIVVLYDRDNDLVLMDITERIIQLLNNVDLTKDGYVYCYNCSYTGEIGAIYYNDTLKANVKTLRFLITFRKEEKDNA
jgi:hypothetical protein